MSFPQTQAFVQQGTAGLIGRALKP
jgi:hypothetical protein